LRTFRFFTAEFSAKNCVKFTRAFQHLHIKNNLVHVKNGEEAIEYLRISKPTFLKYIRHGKLRAIKAGKGWRILLSELNRFLKGEIDANLPRNN
jgi:excisionase family DNA binding protein